MERGVFVVNIVVLRIRTAIRKRTGDPSKALHAVSHALRLSNSDFAIQILQC